MLERGETIQIEKRKQYKKIIDISAKVVSAPKPKSKKQQIIDLINKNKDFAPKHYKSGNALQRSVRN